MPYKNEKIKGIYVIPDYHNPTSHIMSPGDKEKDCRTGQGETYPGN